MLLINTPAGVISWVRGLIFGLSLHLHRYLCIQALKALVSLCICTDSPQSLLLDDAIIVPKSHEQAYLMLSNQILHSDYKCLGMWFN